MNIWPNVIKYEGLIIIKYKFKHAQITNAIQHQLNEEFGQQDALSFLAIAASTTF